MFSRLLFQRIQNLAEFVSEAKQANPEVDDALVNAALGGDIEAVKLHLAVG